MKLTKSGFLKKRKHNFQEICPVFMTECIAETTRKGEIHINFTSLGGKGGHNVIFGFFFSTTEAENQNADRGDVASIMLAHIAPEGRLYSSKSTNGGKGLQNSKINSYFTP